MTATDTGWRQVWCRRCKQHVEIRKVTGRPTVQTCPRVLTRTGYLVPEGASMGCDLELGGKGG